ncbi:hypothetical protein DM02DRAFT_656216 [Periconia macrospinosa]|uniref:Uncharacterized protein n=1 Tax=Periconia macrospinosa TaxID=97972 RepID=A0A2V1DNQ7_9PLEO|nr:hypothetical protein DM02DRAFT_656216 [Periconia macrospinosa]
MAIEARSQQECKARANVHPQAPPSLDDSVYWTKAESLLRVETEMFSSKQEAECAFCFQMSHDADVLRR